MKKLLLAASLLLLSCNKMEESPDKVTVHILYSNGGVETKQISDGEYIPVGNGEYYYNSAVADSIVDDPLFE